MTKKLTTAYIISQVKIKIDEIALNDAEFVSSQDNTEMDTIIKSHIVDALHYLLEHADWSYIDPDTVLTEESYPGKMSIDSNLVGHLLLPDDYLRLCFARFSSWVTYATDVVYWNEYDEYAKLQDPYTTGTWERPKIAIVKRPSTYLELYSAKSADDTWEVGIVSNPSLGTDDDGNECVSVPDRLSSALVYYTAGLTLLTYNEQRADDFFNQAFALSGISVSQS